MSEPFEFPMKRNRYYQGRLLTAADFEAEQAYHREKNRLDNRLLHGAGVICGLGVSVDGGETIVVSSGAALDYDGNEIIVPDPVYRKLPMLEGYRSLKEGGSGWLCLEYCEQPEDKVPVLSGDISRNLEESSTVEEGYRLFLSSETPDFCSILEAGTGLSASVIYSDKDLSAILCIPRAVRAGTEFEIDLYLVRNMGEDTIVFSMEGYSEIVCTENDWLKLSYRQSPNEEQRIIRYSFKVMSTGLSDITDEVFPQGAELYIEYGKRQYRNLVHLKAPVTVCGDRKEYNRILCTQGRLENSLSGSGLPIYLAKLELVKKDNELMIAEVTALPFRQNVGSAEEKKAAGGMPLKIQSVVRRLEYWKDPEVEADYFENTGTISFDFGIPSPNLHDYKVSHGTVDMELPGGLRVNSRKVSDEITHGLGPGNVSVRLAIECITEDNEAVMLQGNSEVFKIRNFDIDLPWVETAAILYPERGTFRVGIWLHDTVPGNRVRVHYFAQKPEYDSDRVLSEKKPEIHVIPEISRTGRGEKLKLKAEVTGVEDTSVLWKIKDAGGGVIDKNGVYEAPQTAGTYEVVAVSGAAPDVQASAFIIVE